jgi:hypothetical protein
MGSRYQPVALALSPREVITSLTHVGRYDRVISVP